MGGAHIYGHIGKTFTHSKNKIVNKTNTDLTSIKPKDRYINYIFQYILFSDMTLWIKTHLLPNLITCLIPVTKMVEG